MSGIHTSYSSAKNISHSVDGGGGGGGVGGGGGNVIHYSSNPEPPVISFNITIPAAAPTSTPNLLPPTEKTVHDDTSHILIYVLVPLGALIVIAALSFLVVFILKKSKLDKLRHHLMPLYNFDPAEEEGDWESELLEEDREQQVALQIRSPTHSNGPTLKFTTESLEV